MRALPTCLVVVSTLLLACQGRGATSGARTPMAVRVVSPRPVTAAAATPVRTGGPTLQAASPTPTPPMVAATALPPTPVPSGYVATLPPGVVLPTFAPLPPERVSGGATVPTLAPVASASPARMPVRIVSNGLSAGEGELSGAIFQPAEPAPRPVDGVEVFVSSVLEPSRKAELVGASDGTFRLSGIALGDYYVRVEKEGYAADTAPTLMRLYPGYTAGHTLFLIVPLP